MRLRGITYFSPPARFAEAYGYQLSVAVMLREAGRRGGALALAPSQLAALFPFLGGAGSVFPDGIRNWLNPLAMPASAIGPYRFCFLHHLTGVAEYAVQLSGLCHPAFPGSSGGIRGRSFSQEAALELPVVLVCHDQQPGSLTIQPRDFIIMSGISLNLLISCQQSLIPRHHRHDSD